MSQTIGQRIRELIESDVDTASLDLLEDVTASAAELNKLDGAGAVVPSGTEQSKINDIAITYSANDPSITPDQAVTVADGTTPTVGELLELCEELKANQDTIIDALEAFGISATS